jgi:hypothetical protein
MTMVAPYTTGALAGFGRRRRALMRAYPRNSGMGQHWYDGLVNWAQNVAGGLPADAPEAGGGSVTVNGVTTYVDSSGNPSSTYDPNAGTTPSIIPPGVLPTIPTWVWWALGATAVALLLGFSGVGKLIPRANPIHRRRHTRRRSRSRR